MNKTLLVLSALALLAALISGCQIESDRTEKPAPDWSRALLLGRANLRQPVALAVDADRHVHVVWCHEGLYYAHLDQEAHVLFNGALAIDLPKPRKPQLLVDGDDVVHLTWLSRQGDRQLLYHARIGPQAQAGQPEQVSGEGENVDRFQAYLSPNGAVSFVWSSDVEGEPQGISIVHLVDLAHPTTLIREGIDPFVLVDADGTAHLAWLRERGYTSRTLHYATFDAADPAAQLAPAGGQRLADFVFAESGVYNGPIIGLDTTHVYVIWSVQNLGGGLTPTAAFSYYVAFELGAPATVNPQRIAIPDDAMPVYEDYPGAYGFTKLHLLSPAEFALGSDFVNAPATVTSRKTELPVAFSLLTRSTAQSQIQTATALFAGGEQVGYQLAGKTEGASVIPTLVADPDANLHLAWIDTAGFQQFDVYYAANAPDARAWLDRTSTDDLVIGAAELLWGVASGIGLLPIAGIWAFPAMVWVVVFFIFSGQEDMVRTPTKIGFAISVVIYVGIKLLLLPGLFRGTPFLHQVPPSLQVAVGMAVPALILAIALLAVYAYSRRAERATIFISYFVFAITDVVLTIVLYAPRFFDPG